MVKRHHCRRSWSSICLSSSLGELATTYARTEDAAVSIVAAAQGRSVERSCVLDFDILLCNLTVMPGICVPLGVQCCSVSCVEPSKLPATAAQLSLTSAAQVLAPFQLCKIAQALFDRKGEESTQEYQRMACPVGHSSLSGAGCYGPPDRPCADIPGCFPQGHVHLQWLVHEKSGRGRGFGIEVGPRAPRPSASSILASPSMRRLVRV